MIERSTLLDSANLPDGTAAAQRGAAKLPCSPAELRTGIVPVEGRQVPTWDSADGAPAPIEPTDSDPHPGGFLGRSPGFQR